MKRGRTEGRRPAAGLPAAVLGSLLLSAAPLAAQTPGESTASQPAGGPRVLTLDAALAVAEKASEQVVIAAAGVTRAEGSARLVRSERLPQLFGSASYDRALKSEFEGLFDSAAPAPCDPLRVDPTAPLEDRVAELERAYDCQPSGGLFGGGGEDAPDLPFGRANTYRLGFSFSQVLFTAGRIQAQERQAALRRNNAVLGLDSARAQALLDVAQAYYDAALADRLVAIADATYEQADRSLAQTVAWRDAGRISEFELLRARVARDTLQPNVVRSRANREIAYLRLKQLLELPLNEPLQLAADLENEALPPPERFAPRVADVEAGAAQPVRLAVTQGENDVRGAEEDVYVARAARLPSVSLTSNYGLVAYPSSVPAFGDWRTNWTVGVSLSLPILDGGRIAANTAIARAGVDEAQARLRLTRELAALDAESVRQELIAARAEWMASGGPIVEAGRAYEIAELRFREGLSTQLELSDSRLLLAQSQATRARAARDLQVLRIRYALLPELPLGGAAGSAAPAAGASQAAGRAQLATQPTSARAGAAAAPAAGVSGGQ